MARMLSPVRHGGGGGDGGGDDDADDCESLAVFHAHLACAYRCCSRHHLCRLLLLVSASYYHLLTRYEEYRNRSYHSASLGLADLRDLHVSTALSWADPGES